MTPETPEIQKNYLGETQEPQESLSSSPFSQALRLSPLLSPIAPLITLALQEFDRISDYYDSAHQQISSLEQQRDEDIKSYKTLSAHDHLLGIIIAEQIDSLAPSSSDFPTLHAILTNPTFDLLPDSDFGSILCHIDIKNKLKRASDQS